MEIYDSDSTATTAAAQAARLWSYRGLVRLLVKRNLTIRYKRSVLGASWTLLNPLMTAAVMWLVFSRVFRFATPGVPYVVYMMSGVILAAFFVQGVTQTAHSITAARPILTKVYVPAEAFAIAAAMAACVNFALGILPLVAVQLLTGTGLPWTVLLVPIPALALLALVAGLGLLVAAGAVLFYDVFDITAVVLQAVGYLTPTFYPLAIVPEGFRTIIEVNPVHSYLLVFRSFMYEGSFPPAWALAYMGFSALLALLVGTRVFSRSWKSLVVLL